MASARINRTPKKRELFLDMLAETGNVTKACASADIGHTTVYQWRKDDPEFAEQWDRALDIAADILELEARRRAVDGVDEPLTHNGQITYQYTEALDANGNIMRHSDGTPIMRPILDANGNKIPVTVKKYSDTLLIFLLKGNKPEKFRERAEVRHQGQLTVEKVSAMSTDDIAAELARRGIKSDE